MLLKLKQAKGEADSRIRELSEQTSRLAQENQQLYALLAKCTCKEVPHSLLRNRPHVVPQPSKHVRMPERRPPPPMPIHRLSQENSVEADSGIAVTSTSPTSTSPSPARPALSAASSPKEEGKIELTVSAYNSCKTAPIEEPMMTPDSSQEVRSGSPLDLSQNSRSVLDLSQPSDDVLDLRKQ